MSTSTEQTQRIETGDGPVFNMRPPVDGKDFAFLPGGYTFDKEPRGYLLEAMEDGTWDCGPLMKAQDLIDVVNQERNAQQPLLDRITFLEAENARLREQMQNVRDAIGGGFDD